VAGIAPMARETKLVYTVCEDAGALAERAAEYFAQRINEAVKARGVARVAISGGSTPKRTFETLAQRGKGESGIPWEQVQLYWVDERCVPPDNQESNYRMTREAMLDAIPLPAASVFRIEGELPPEKAAARYESVIRGQFRLEGAEIPRFDVVQLGMGDDGHTASLFPGSPNLPSALNASAVAGCVGMRSPVPPHPRLSLNLTALLGSRRIVVLITGESKLRTLAAACAPGPVEDMPVRAVLRQTRTPVDVIWSP